ncbi:AMP-binding protein [Hazenella sp. IB182353]|uniref:AMP-binding protein n=1 Tax=Polycladospora coralii TaxID=2771432 RepID=UPI0017473ACB|nr:AMP-binding protein [Polycladospora coralii]MBS7529418.1 AMP-binding protein [Polycladospora coralii]
MTAVERPWYNKYPSYIPKQIDYPDVPLTQFLVDSANDFPQNEAIYFLGKSITFKQLLDDVYRFANSLKELGVKKGDRVGIMLPNSPQAVIAYYATLFVGGVVVQINPLYVERELEHQLQDSGTETLVCLDLLYPRVEKVRPGTQLKNLIVTSVKDYLPFPKNWLYPLTLRKDGIKVNVPKADNIFSFKSLIQKTLPTPVTVPYESGNDLALLQYTGGTTGLAKGAMLSHRNLIVNAIQAANWLNATDRDGQSSVVGALPFFHVYGMTVVMNFAMLIGATMLLVPKFDVKEILDMIEKKRPTFFPGAPTMYVGLINYPKIKDYDLSSVKACISGSAPLPLDVQQKFEEITGGFLVEGFGMTETSPVTHCNLIWNRERSGTIGLPWPDTDARIVDPETKEELPIGETGELMVKGPQVMQGYWNRPEDTKKTINEEGWLSTGDMARTDEDGYFFIMDRKKDMIIAGGFNIYPREVEEVLFEHPAIQEAAVVGVPHPYRGETVKATIVLKEAEHITEEELDQFCREKLAKYKVPRIYEFRKELPKTAVGKVLRRVIQEEAVEQMKNEEKEKEAVAN